MQAGDQMLERELTGCRGVPAPPVPAPEAHAGGTPKVNRRIFAAQILLMYSPARVPLAPAAPMPAREASGSATSRPSAHTTGSRQPGAACRRIPSPRSRQLKVHAGYTAGTPQVHLGPAPSPPRPAAPGAAGHASGVRSPRTSDLDGHVLYCPGLLAKPGLLFATAALARLV